MHCKKRTYINCQLPDQQNFDIIAPASNNFKMVVQSDLKFLVGPKFSTASETRPKTHYLVIAESALKYALDGFQLHSTIQQSLCYKTRMWSYITGGFLTKGQTKRAKRMNKQYYDDVFLSWRQQPLDKTMKLSLQIVCCSKVMEIVQTCIFSSKKMQNLCICCQQCMCVNDRALTCT